MSLTLRNIALNMIYYAVVVVVLPGGLLLLERGLGFSERPLLPLRIAAGVVGVFGALLQIWCIVIFQRVGRGTPSPLFPPMRLVTRGPYRVVRNPMNIGELMVFLALAGWFASWFLLAYALGAAIAFHGFIKLWEEPRHAEKHGDEYARYRASVGRWIPRFVRDHDFRPLR
ncbi:MAG TPA: isoprenylcysteine carboxylmethyltransferase family protein [Blastocatellia bacterium]|nr:isoprenylcysteine carboxylmethyltransferase family protein [Blastocatellia bacterium]